MSQKRIAVIDYGMGNLHSVASAVQHVSPLSEVLISHDANVIASADHVIFPGVGAIRDCMAEIRRLGIDRIVAQTISNGTPMLAICVGMQALTNMSEENGGVEGLSHFDGAVKFFGNHPDFQLAANPLEAKEARLKVPHMGWNEVMHSHHHPIWQGISNRARFYFVHSYYVALENSDVQIGGCRYGIDFTAAMARDALVAVQFHPEKSHTEGLQLLKNFVNWNGQG